MKRIFQLASAFLAIMLLAGTPTMFAQQNEEGSNKVIIIQKTQNDDGTYTVKKKSIVGKGEQLDTYLNEIKVDGVQNVNVNKDGENVEIVIVTDGKAPAANEETETLMYFRKGQVCDQMNWSNDKDLMDGVQSMRIAVPFSPEMQAKMDEKIANVHITTTESKALLGVYPEASDKGVVITSLVSGGGAEAAGLQSNDVIISVNGSNLANKGSLSKVMTTFEPGETVSVVYLRDGQTNTASVTLTERKEKSYTYNYNYNYNYDYNYNYNYKVERDPCVPFIGVYVGSYGEGRRGVGINGIIEGWPAEAAGLTSSDRILALDGVPVNSNEELVRERDKHKAGDYFTLTVLRNGVEEEVEAQFKECPTDKATEQVTEEYTQTAPPVNQPVEFIDNSLQLDELNAFPNPTFGNLNIQFRGEAVPTYVTITDINGKVVYKDDVKAFDGYYNKEVDISKGATGAMILSVRQGNKIASTQVVLLNRA